MLTSIVFNLDLLSKVATVESAAIEQAAVGVRLIVTLKEGADALDISDATTKNICLRSPSSIDSALTATFVTDGSDGQIYFDTLVTTLDELGAWKISAHVIGPTYERKSPSYGVFKVVSSICT